MRKIMDIFGPEAVSLYSDETEYTDPLSPFIHENQKENWSTGNELWLRKSFNHLMLESAAYLVHQPSHFTTSRDPLELCRLWL